MEFFLNLIERAVPAGWVVLAVLLLRLPLRRAPRWIFCLLWGLVALRLLCPVFPESPVSLQMEMEIQPAQLLQMQQEALHEPTRVELATNPAIAAPVQLEFTGSVGYAQIKIMYLFLIWVAGVGILLAYSLISWMVLHHRIATATILHGNIRQSDRVDTPFVFGLLRPKIILPYSLQEPERSHVIAHEQAHIRRGDHWWKPLGFLLLSIYWFHPLLWVAYALLCRDMEAACDERVIRALEPDGRKDYARALLQCGTRRSRIAACPLAFGEIGVKSRILRVVNYKKPVFWLLLLAILAVVITAVLLLTDPPEAAPDLSFLNYENAASRVIERSSVFSIWYPSEDEDQEGAIVIGETSGRSLGIFLDLEQWRQRRPPWNTRLPSPGSVEFVLEDDYRITIYETPCIAKVRYGEEVRWYHTERDSYAEAAALLEPAGTYSRPVIQWFNHTEDHAEAITDFEQERTKELAEYPGTTFRTDYFEIKAVNDIGETSLLFGMPVVNAFFADLNGDDRRELCATVAFGSGMGDLHVIVIDYAKGREYALWERGQYDYELRWEDGSLICDRRVHFRGEIVETGYLTLNEAEGVLQIIPNEK